MSLYKIDLTIYGDSLDNIYLVLPDLMRIIKANNLEYKVGEPMKQQVT